jgi:hypothetical protein
VFTGFGTFIHVQQKAGKARVNCYGMKGMIKQLRVNLIFNWFIIAISLLNETFA